FARSALPRVRERGWTMLVQGVDLHHDGARALLEQFRFVPDARLDDVMVSWASDGGGVGPHVDSYDVFLLQARGTRRWRIAQRLAETYDDPALYADAQQSATTSPAAIPPALARFAADAVRRLAARPAAIERALGEVLSEPKPHVWFTKRTAPGRLGPVTLDR